MFHGRICRAAVLMSVLWGLGITAADARAGRIEIVSDSAVADPIGRQTSFSVTFNRPPDFFGFDSLGRANHAFQYFYDSEPTDGPDGIFSGESVVILRGPEIRFRRTIPVRDSLNPDGIDFPNAEGWGPMRDEVDFALDGSTVHFTVPWKALGETDGRFSYHLIALERGDQTSEVSATVIPLPPGARAGVPALVAAGWAAWRWRNPRRPRPVA